VFFDLAANRCGGYGHCLHDLYRIPHFVVRSFHFHLLSKHQTVSSNPYIFHPQPELPTFFITPQINFKTQLLNTTAMSDHVEETAILGLRAQILGKHTA
jgi:hypothetical protein